MRAALFKFFSRFFKKELAQIRQQATDSFKRHQDGARRDIEILEAQMQVGHPVIYISNEYDNLVVGFAVSIQFVTQAKCPMLMVHDYVTNREVMVHAGWPTLQRFSHQVLNTLISMDRNSLISIMYGRYRSDSQPITKKPASTYVTSPKFVGILQRNGFYTKLSEYEASKMATSRRFELQEH